MHAHTKNLFVSVHYQHMPKIQSVLGNFNNVFQAYLEIVWTLATLWPKRLGMTVALDLINSPLIEVWLVLYLVGIVLINICVLLFVNLLLFQVIIILTICMVHVTLREVFDFLKACTKWIHVLCIYRKKPIM